MGNGESSERPARSDSLSNGADASSFGLPVRPRLDSIHSSPFPLARQTSWNNSDLVITSPTGESRSRTDARRLLREELFCASSDELGLMREQSQTEHNLQFSGGPEYSNAGRMPPKAQSRKQSGGIDVVTAISLLQDLKKTATKEELSALQQVLLPGAPTGNRQIEDFSNAPADPAIAALIRRRSLLTPGLATRNDASITARKPLPRPQTDIHLPRHQTWEPHMFGKSPLTRLASIESKDVYINDPIKRALTPSDHDSMPLGAHKLGSLRITNNASPDFRQAHLALSPRTLKRDEEYFTASEGRSSPEGPDDRPSTSGTSMRGTATPVQDGCDWYSNPKLQTTTSSPNLASTNVPLGRTSTVQRRYSELAINPFVEMTELVEMDSLPETSLTPKGIANPQHDLTNFASVQSRNRGVTEGSLAHSNDKGWYKVRGRPFRTGQYAVDAPKALSDASSIYGDDSKREINPERPLRKADSGYGSEASLKAKSPSTNADLAVTYDGRIDQYQAEQQAYDDTASITQSLLSLQRALASTPPVISAAVAPMSRNQAAFAVFEPTQYPITTPEKLPYNIPPQMNAHDTPSPNSSNQKSSPTRLKAKKLQKRRPISQSALSTPITVQRLRSISGNQIPTIPRGIALQHSHRLSKCPDMMHLEHTFDSVSECDTRSSGERTATPEFHPICFPSPGTSPGKENELPERGRIQNSSEPQSMQRLVRSLSRRNSQRRSSLPAISTREPVITGVADLGTSAESIGRSPYDIARAFPPHGLDGIGQTNKTHPHQVSNTGLRSKKRVGMDDMTASALAWKRSRDRADFLKHSNNNGMPRPRSFHGSEFDEQTPVLTPPRRRPYSVYDEVPISTHEPHRTREPIQIPPQTSTTHRTSRMPALTPGPPKTTLASLPPQARRSDTEPDLRAALRPPPGPFSGLAAHRRPFPPPSVTITPSWSYQADQWRQRRQLVGQDLAAARQPVLETNTPPKKSKETLPRESRSSASTPRQQSSKELPLKQLSPELADSPPQLPKQSSPKQFPEPTRRAPSPPAVQHASPSRAMVAPKPTYAPTLIPTPTPAIITTAPSTLPAEEASSSPPRRPGRPPTPGPHGRRRTHTKPELPPPTQPQQIEQNPEHTHHQEPLNPPLADTITGTSPSPSPIPRSISPGMAAALQQLWGGALDLHLLHPETASAPKPEQEPQPPHHSPTPPPPPPPKDGRRGRAPTDRDRYLQVPRAMPMAAGAGAEGARVLGMRDVAMMLRRVS